MIKIIINGCNGTMGFAIAEAVSNSDGFEVAAGVDLYGEPSVGWSFPVYKTLKDVKEQADVVIDFSRADGVSALLSDVAAKGLPIVIATTGLTEEHHDRIREFSKVIPVLQAANMSLGINLLKLLAKQATAVLSKSFDIEIIEKHHNKKVDAPSGTALALADAIKSSTERSMEYVYGREERNKLRADSEIGIHAVRGGTIVGEHDIIFAGKDERLTLSHGAYSKGLFAVGALNAAEYLFGKDPGFYSMDDMIAEKTTITNFYTSEEALVNFNKVPASFGTSHYIFQAFSDAGINIDMISQTITEGGFHSLSFSIKNDCVGEVSSLLKKLKKENEKLAGTVMGDLSKITVEGIGMESQSGVASSLFGLLDELKVESKSVTTSETKISFIISREFHEKVVSQLKERFNL